MKEMTLRTQGLDCKGFYPPKKRSPKGGKGVNNPFGPMGVWRITVFLAQGPAGFAGFCATSNFPSTASSITKKF
jgi:hypothetical protein